MLSRRVFLLGAVGVGLASCGLPDDDRPRAIDDPPRDLVPTTAPPVESGGTRVDLYFIDTETRRLRAVRRQVETRNADAVVGLLLQGLGPGTLTTSIPPDTVLNRTRLDGDVLVIDLGPANGGIVGVDATVQLQAFAQLVFTATALPDVGSVRFTIGGNALEATADAGTVRDRPVDRSDYQSLAPGNDNDS